MIENTYTKSTTGVECDTETRILVVDDDETLAKFFKIHLNKYFSKVFVTGDANEAFDWFKTEPFDLVITDMNLPRLEGVELLKKVRKVDKDVPIIFMTNLDLAGSQKQKMDLADAVLTKPFTMKEFHLCLSQGLKKNLIKSNEVKDYELYSDKFYPNTRNKNS